MVRITVESKNICWIHEYTTREMTRAFLMIAAALNAGQTIVVEQLPGSELVQKEKPDEEE